MGDGTKENPYTREDVLKLIEENGGKAEGLDLSGKTFEEGIDLSGLNLSGIKLNNVQLFRANFNGSNLDRAIMQNTYLGYATFNPLESEVASLQGVDLRGANLHDAEFREADLSVAQFQETKVQGTVYPPELQGKLLELLPASLERTDFRGANLFRANFKGCYFYGTKLEGAYIRGADILEAYLDEADWGSYIIGEESKKEKLPFAESMYRRLKQWYTNAGHYDIAGEFFFREMEAKRKSMKWWPSPRHRVWVEFVSLICGYGERPPRVFLWAASVVLGLAFVYFAIGSGWEWRFFGDYLYFSAVSFTALGYGSWLTTSNYWIRGIGAFESFIGVFTIALFLITFVRKMRR